MEIPSQSQNSDIDLNVKELASEIESGNELFLLYVREYQETQISKLENSLLIPLGDLPERIKELDANSNIVVYCCSGARSDQAMRLLRKSGFK
jgi:rhodanese-related sulfurtransferase